MESDEMLARQMREAIEYLSSVELMETPLQITQGVTQLNPKKHFEVHLPIVRAMWKNPQMRGIYIYHFYNFYKAVKAHFDEKQNAKQEEPVDKAPAGKAGRAKKPAKGK